MRLVRTHDTRRLLSPMYLRAGMGDGGGCHPRDNIAMSHLARRLRLSFDFFECLMLARERQTGWIAATAIEAAADSGLPIVLLGETFKPETNLIAGSPAILLRNLLEAQGHKVSVVDPQTRPAVPIDQGPAVYVVATNHPEFIWPAFRARLGHTQDVVPAPIRPAPTGGRVQAHSKARADEQSGTNRCTAHLGRAGSCTESSSQACAKPRSDR